MSCRVYTVGISQDGKRYEADLILSDRVVRGALEQRSTAERIADRASGLYRRLRRIPERGYREPHTIKQYLVNQFNSAILSSQGYQDFVTLVADRKAEAAQSRHPRSVTIPSGFRPIELREFRQLAIAAGRRASLREHAQYLVLALMNISDALTVGIRWPADGK